MLIRLWMFAITLAALCALCSGCKLVTVRSQAVSGTYVSILSDTSASGVNFDRTAEGSIKVSVERYQSNGSLLRLKQPTRRWTWRTRWRSRGSSWNA